jgi:tetratricopeptide (TPR) repeat protein
MFTWGSYEARMGNCPKALRLLEQARTEYDGPHLYLLLGTCYRQTGHFKKAEKNIKHAMWMQPQKMYPRYLLAKLYKEKGYQEKAVHEARQLLQMKQKIPTPAGRQIKQKMQAMIRNVSER